MGHSGKTSWTPVTLCHSVEDLVWYTGLGETHRPARPGDDRPYRLSPRTECSTGNDGIPYSVRSSRRRPLPSTGIYRDTPHVICSPCLFPPISAYTVSLPVSVPFPTDPSGSGRLGVDTKGQGRSSTIYLGARPLSVRPGEEKRHPEGTEVDIPSFYPLPSTISLVSVTP